MYMFVRYIVISQQNVMNYAGHHNREREGREMPGLNYLIVIFLVILSYRVSL